MRKKKSFRSLLTLLWLEGAFAITFEAWLGPTCLSGLAGELGVGVGTLGLLAAAPSIGAIGQLGGVLVYGQGRSVKRYALGANLASRALWIVPLFLAGFFSLGARSQGQQFHFHVEPWASIVAVVACLSAILSALGTAAWMSWVNGLMRTGVIPSKFLGRFFGIRQRYVMVALLFANALASACVGWRVGACRAGYFVLGILALCSATASLFLLSKIPDVSRPIIPCRDREFGLRVMFREISGNRRFRNALILGASFFGAMQFSAPFLPYYFTKELSYSMGLVFAWTVMASLGSILFAGVWGHRLDRGKNRLGILLLSANIIAITPLFYCLTSTALILWVAPLEYFINGIAWSGYSLASMALLYEACPKERSGPYFSIYTAMIGVAGVTGNLLGSVFAHWATRSGDYRMLWLVGAFLRFSAIWCSYRLLFSRNHARARIGGVAVISR